MLIIEVEGGERGNGGAARQDHRDRQDARREVDPQIDVGDGERADLEGPQIGVRRDRPDRRLYLHGRHGADRADCPKRCGARARSSPPTACASPMCFTPATATCIRWSSTTSMTRPNRPRPKRRATTLLKLCVDLGGCLTGEHGVGIEKRDLMTHQFSRQDLAQQNARARGVRSRLAAQSGKGLSAGGKGFGMTQRRARKLTPASEVEAAELVSEARAEGRQARHRRRRHARRARPPRRGERRARHRADVGIVFYEPAEMVVCAQAGTAVEAVEAVIGATRANVAVRTDGSPRRSMEPRASRRSADWSRATFPVLAASAPARRAMR